MKQICYLNCDLTTESDQRTLAFFGAVTHRKYICTLAQTAVTMNDAVMLHNGALTVFMCLPLAVVKAFCERKRVAIMTRALHSRDKQTLFTQCSSLQPFM